MLRFLMKPYKGRLFTLIASNVIYFPTTTDELLGTEKWRLAPSLGVVWDPLPHFFFAPLYFHQFSYPGADSRADIHVRV